MVFQIFWIGWKNIKSWIGLSIDIAWISILQSNHMLWRFVDCSFCIQVHYNSTYQVSTRWERLETDDQLLKQRKCILALVEIESDVEVFRPTADCKPQRAAIRDDQRCYRPEKWSIPPDDNSECIDFLDFMETDGSSNLQIPITLENWFPWSSKTKSYFFLLYFLFQFEQE